MNSQVVKGILVASLIIVLVVVTAANAAVDPLTTHMSRMDTNSESTVLQSATDNVIICHVLGSSDHQTLTVAASAVAKHLRHGDYLGPCATYGDQASLGNGSARTYVQTFNDGTPYAIGVEFPAAMLSNLPFDPPFDGNNCWDVDEDGVLSPHHPHECVGGHQRILFLPHQAAPTPFTWVLLNWNPIGHAPPGTYSVPHFDFHFYIMDYVERNYIRPGPCAFLVNCDDFEKATVPVPEQFLPQDYEDLEAVEVRMGNHLIDLSSPEFGPGGQDDFTHTFIFGAYEGRITFWEPMITVQYLESKPNQCTAIKLPAAYEISGFYPTEYCIRYRPSRADYTVSLEGFTYRQAP